MTDYFAVLGQPRQPHLDPTALEREFQKRARSLHPDIAGADAAEAFAELNRAYATLLNARLRLQHLLALEGSETRQTPFSADWMKLFSRAAEIAHRVEAELRRLGIADSAITRSMTQVARNSMSKQLEAVLQELKLHETGAQQELEQLNSTWDRDRVQAINEALGLQQRFAFLERWLTTLRELQFQLQN